MDVLDERESGRGKNSGGAGTWWKRERRGRRDEYWEIGNMCLGGRDERKRMIAPRMREEKGGKEKEKSR